MVFTPKPLQKFKILNMKKLLFTSGLSLLVLSLFAQIDILSTDSVKMEGQEPGINAYSTISNSSNSVSTDSLAGRKIVFWVHGLAGNEHSWNRIQATTENQTGTSVSGYPERNTEGLALSYKGHENLDIFQLGAYVNNSIMEIWRVAIPRRDTLKVEQNFAIAHSQGGVLGRAIRFKNIHEPSNYSQQYGALATFGSPHGGALIINSTQSGGAVQQWINNGCKAIAQAEIRTFLNTKWWLDATISTNAVQSFSNSTCDGLNKIALPILVNAIRKPVGGDYAVGAQNLAKLDSMARQDTMKVVTFYGVEQEPVLWRTIHSMTYTKDSSITGNPLSSNPFGLNDDQELPRFVNNRINDYLAKKSNQLSKARSYRNAAAVAFWISPLSTIALIQLSNEAKRKAIIYREAANWLASSNTNWKRFIGARRDTSYAYGYHCECTIWEEQFGNYGSWQTITNHVLNPADCNHPDARSCAVSTYILHTVIEEPNDGVVTKSSQIGYPGKWDLKKMTNTNHMQERNCEETMKRLNELFDGAYGSNFRLDRK